MVPKSMLLPFSKGLPKRLRSWIDGTSPSTWQSALKHCSQAVKQRAVKQDRFPLCQRMGKRVLLSQFPLPLEAKRSDCNKLDGQHGRNNTNK